MCLVLPLRQGWLVREWIETLLWKVLGLFLGSGKVNTSTNSSLPCYWWAVWFWETSFNTLNPNFLTYKIHPFIQLWIFIELLQYVILTRDSMHNVAHIMCGSFLYYNFYHVVLKLVHIYLSSLIVKPLWKRPHPMILVFSAHNKMPMNQCFYSFFFFFFNEWSCRKD